jgi:hypothetical protein
MMPSTAHCPACGGEIHPLAGRCKHCKVDLGRLREMESASKAAVPQAPGQPAARDESGPNQVLASLAAPPPSRHHPDRPTPPRSAGPPQQARPGPAPAQYHPDRPAPPPVVQPPTPDARAPAPSQHHPDRPTPPPSAGSPQQPAAVVPPPSPVPAPTAPAPITPPPAVVQQAAPAYQSQPQAMPAHSAWARRWPLAVGAIALLAIGISLGILIERSRQESTPTPVRSKSGPSSPRPTPDFMPDPGRP